MVLCFNLNANNPLLQSRFQFFLYMRAPELDGLPYFSTPKMAFYLETTFYFVKYWTLAFTQPSRSPNPHGHPTFTFTLTLMITHAHVTITHAHITFTLRSRHADKNERISVLKIFFFYWVDKKVMRNFQNF
jgi:hypothetical protein